MRGLIMAAQQQARVSLYPTDGLISHWKLDEDPAVNNGIIADSFGVNDAELRFGDLDNRSVDGKVDKAIRFKGGVDRAIIGDIDYLPSYGICAWVYQFVVGNVYDHIFSKGGIFNNDTNYSMSIRQHWSAFPPINRLVVGHRNGSELRWQEMAMIDDLSPVEVWNHYYVGFHDGEFFVYQNGVKLTEQAGGNDAPHLAPSDNNYNALIGGPHDTANNNRYIDAIIDDVFLYNRILTQAEIQQIYGR